ncbi:hypothetical protein [Methylobacterium planeticum]|uniref:Uncharacterized protein n=1 Tax=Methylobacterium planeticum TaxID=2615211 RepID=A0A6N6MV76_9HYPH|nr:hypothetical protein [Methylobacterium planeticum]KAB1074606.1 hypothetical protein F6X51_05590 [Methylobacterium planeticum]
MNADMRKFLGALAGHDGPIAVRSLGIGCTVRQGIARQDARRLGYAVFESGCWSITLLGRMALLRIVGRRAA